MLTRTYVEPRRKLEKFLDMPIEKISDKELAQFFPASKGWRIIERKSEVGVFGSKMIIVTFEKK